MTVANDILDNIAATLAGITTDNGFNTDVANVERVLRTWNEVPAYKRPLIGLSYVETRYHYLPAHRVKVELRARMVAHVQGAAGEAKETALLDLEEDIHKALAADTTRGGKAICTNVWKTYSDAPDGATDTETFGTSGTVVLECNVYYLDILK